MVTVLSYISLLVVALVITLVFYLGLLKIKLI
uniref:Cytochrome b6-f complex subunit 6 n=1 Tax=Parachlorella kessleri TaxID=3074 RepID=C7BEY9_PARKE|nr:cytochrome b6/f complex subunit VI [Parachlorella kessleri]ACQ90930.1 subunit VI of cytochrome b6/f complex [Parachlorella kessleri]